MAEKRRAFQIGDRVTCPDIAKKFGNGAAATIEVFAHGRAYVLVGTKRMSVPFEGLELVEVRTFQNGDVVTGGPLSARHGEITLIANGRADVLVGRETYVSLDVRLLTFVRHDSDDSPDFVSLADSTRA